MARLNIGIYGCTKAGKTRFLFQLLHGWEKQRRLLHMTDACRRFLATIEAELSQYQGSTPTTAKLDDIGISVQRIKQPELEIVIRDLRGEMLSEQLDHLEDASIDQDIPAQVRCCDGFLFFFDPIYSENPAKMHEHHEREIERASHFIDYVLKQRQNRYLPILFVQTHLDLWENNSIYTAKAQTWLDLVYGELKQSYQRQLQQHFPEDLLRRDKIFWAISSIRDHEGEKVIYALEQLVTESQKFQSRSRKQARLPLMAGVGFSLLLLIWLIWFIWSGTSHKPHAGSRADPTAVAQWTEEEILQELTDLEQLLVAHPSGQQIPNASEAKRIHDHLEWMIRRLELGDKAPTPVPASLLKRIQEMLDRTVTIIAPKAAPGRSSELEDQITILSTYLEDLPDASALSPKLGQLQADFWKRYRSLCVDRMRGTLRRRIEVASTPLDTISDLISDLRKQEQELRRVNVLHTQNRQTLLDELRTTITFSDDRKTSRKYPLTVRVISARYTTKWKLDNNWRSLSLYVPGQDGNSFTIELIPQTPAEPQTVSFATKKPQYPIQMALGKSIRCTLYIYAPASSDWNKIKEFDLITDTTNSAWKALGIPLVLPAGQTEIIKLLEWEGYEIKLGFGDLPKVPTLLLDAISQLDKE